MDTKKKYERHENGKHPLDVDSAVRYCLAKHQITRAELSRRSGVSNQVLMTIRRGQSTSTDSITKIARAFGYTPLQFLMLSEERWITVATTGSNGH